MKAIIEKSLKNMGFCSSSYTIHGKDEYFQINIEAGWCISIEALRQNIYNYADIFVQTNVSCVHTDEYGYCLMIELFW